MQILAPKPALLCLLRDDSLSWRERILRLPPMSAWMRSARTWAPARVVSPPLLSSSEPVSRVVLTWVTELPLPLFFAPWAPRSRVKPFCSPMLKLAPIAVLLVEPSFLRSTVSWALCSNTLFLASNKVLAAFRLLPVISILPWVPGASPVATIDRSCPALSVLWRAVRLLYSLLALLRVLASSVPILINEPLLGEPPCLFLKPALWPLASEAWPPRL